ncbi:MAG: hypothetical protein ACRD1R_02040 [Acidobacteriota bacterium]
MDFPQRVAIAAGITSLIVVVILLLWKSIQILLPVFGGVLFAIILLDLRNLVHNYFNLFRAWSLAVVLLLLFGIFGLGGWLMAPSVNSQLDQLSESLSSP